ncbi:MAG: leucine-rich repeat domain-containing protein [Kiritimatiellaeota bacterium]|nr:leucine-rich repeat domain-containing protein [Kiritimatiellota bacterium]
MKKSLFIVVGLLAGVAYSDFNAYVYSGGARIEVPEGLIRTVDIPLERPTGLGVSAINISNGGSGYIAPPYVHITGGGGNGATAIANIDREFGKVTSIEITSPGTGYTSNPTVEFLGGGGSGVTYSVVIAPNISGGLTKTGGGTLILNAPCTYTGPTVVEAGTLVLARADAIHPDSEIIIGSYGTLDLGGYELGGNPITGEGTIVNGTLGSEVVISPAGDNAIGELTLSNVIIGSGVVYRVTIHDPVCDLITFSSEPVDLTGLTIVPSNPESAAPAGSSYIIATAEGGFIGRPALDGFDPEWRVICNGNELLLTTQAMTYYVSPNGNDTAAGTSWETAKQTIQVAIDLANRAGDEVVVTNGVYAPVVATNGITIKSVNGAETTIIDGGGTNRCAALDSGTTLTGFTLTNGTVTNRSVFAGNYGGGANGGTLNTCVLTGNKTASRGGGAYGSILNNCILTGNKAPNGGGAYGCTLNNCTLTGNEAGSSPNNGGGLALSKQQGTCIIIRGGGGIAVAYGCTVNNSVVWGNIGGNWTNCAVRYSCTTPLPTGTSDGGGNIDADPLFVDAANGDFRLSANSPCLKAGDVSSVVGTLDLDGQPRIQNGKVDMGAYQSFQGIRTETVGGYIYTYEVVNGGVTITTGVDYQNAISPSPVGTLTIPSSLGGYPVVAIGDYAFYDCDHLANVIIPEGVMSIGGWAFAFCWRLRSITISSGVTSIGDYAFYFCDRLTSMTIPPSVTSIGDWAFAECIGLCEVFMEGNAPCVGIDVYDWTPSSLTTYVMPGSKGWDGNPNSMVLPVQWNQRNIAYLTQ